MENCNERHLYTLDEVIDSIAPLALADEPKWTGEVCREALYFLLEYRSVKNQWKEYRKNLEDSQRQVMERNENE